MEKPAPFPKDHFAALPIPYEFAREISKAADADGVLFADKLLTWARMGALCDRSHTPRPARRKRK